MEMMINQWFHHIFWRNPSERFSLLFVTGWHKYSHPLGCAKNLVILWVQTSTASPKAHPTVGMIPTTMVDIVSNQFSESLIFRNTMTFWPFSLGVKFATMGKTETFVTWSYHHYHHSFLELILNRVRRKLDVLSRYDISHISIILVWWSYLGCMFSAY